MIKHMVMEPTDTLTEQHILENGLKISSMVGELSLGQMVLATMVSTKMVKKMVRAILLSPMAAFTLVSFKIMKFLAKASTAGQTAKSMMVLGLRTKCTV